MKSTPLMKALFCLLLLLSVRPGVSSGQGCCGFSLKFEAEASGLPPKTIIDSCLNQTTDCDKGDLLFARLIHAYRDRDLASFHAHFEKVILLPGLDQEDLLKYSALYAHYLELFGKTSNASIFYQYILSHTAEQNFAHQFARVGMTGISSSRQENEQLSARLSARAGEFENIQEGGYLTLLLKHLNYIPKKEKFELAMDNLDAYEVETSTVNKFYFLSFYLFLSLDFEMQSDERRWRELEAISKDVQGPMKNNFWNRLRIKKANSAGEYERSLEIARRRVVEEFGEFATHADLQTLIAAKENRHLSWIHTYAHEMLYQSRLGKGISPVIQAFELYESSYERQVLDYFFSPSNLVRDRMEYAGADPYNQLIIGNYLYEKTGDLDYLNRSFKIVEGITGAGLNYWTVARRLMATDAGFRKAVTELRTAAEELNALSSEETLHGLFKKTQRLEVMREDLRSDYPQINEQMEQIRSIDLAALQAQMTDDTAGLVGFYAQHSTLYRLYVAGDSIEVRVLNGAKAKILTLADELKQSAALNKNSDASTKAARQLYQLLFAGIGDHLPGRLHIIAEGELAGVPFAALRRDTTGAARYLGVDCALSRQFSIGNMLLLDELELSAPAPYPLALAPAFASESLPVADLRQAGYQLAPLLYNIEEVEQLSEISRGDFYLQREARLSAYQAAASQHSIIHLATHAISSQTDGLRSRIFLLDDESSPVSLYASDIGDQTLNADLVVLSACETGTGGQHAVEGTIGLHRAYLAAGARSVVASQWAVDDYATAELMKGLYRELAAGKSPDLALRDARRTYLARHPDASPYKWAAFEAYGGMRPVRWERKRQPSTLLLVGGLALVAAGTGWVIKKSRNAA